MLDVSLYKQFREDVSTFFLFNLFLFVVGFVMCYVLCFFPMTRRLFFGNTYMQLYIQSIMHIQSAECPNCVEFYHGLFYPWTNFNF